MLLRMQPGHIHLWLCFYDEVKDYGLLATYRDLLNEEERDQLHRFRFIEDQNRYLITRALVRTILSRYSSIRPENWLFTKDRYGRPKVANADRPTKAISFSISHTAGLILCGLACELTLGVDVENFHVRTTAHSEIADRFFSPSEAAALRKLSKNIQPERFFHYWTLKESYIKARGLGLSVPLDCFAFRFTGENDVRVSFDLHPQDHPERWRFWLFKPSADHVAGICVQRSSCIRLIMRRVVPLRIEEPFTCPILRKSVE
jgi:4'-phosphopantetheinyl transferase